MKYKSMVNICLSRFLSEYKIKEFYDKISLNIGAKVMTFGTIITKVMYGFRHTSTICGYYDKNISII